MTISTYEQAKEYLESHIRMDVFTRYDADKHLINPLERMNYFLSLLGNPHTKYKSVQVTGTSGKGSTAYVISHILATAGYKTGFTLSPHLQSPHERMQINNQPISDEAFIDLLNDIIPSIEKMTKESIGKPSYFEILLAMALLYFAKEKVEIVIAEVGLEGKYDGTNTLSPLVVVLTNISLDHTAILGGTVEKIAQEAVEAIKKQDVSPVVVSGFLQPSVEAIVMRRCEQMGASYSAYQKNFSSQIQSVTNDKTVFSFSSQEKSFTDIELSLKGRYQVDNTSLAIETIVKLTELGFPVDESTIKQSLKQAFFPGRFELFAYEGKTIILDGAHNEAKMTAFLEALEEYYPDSKKNFVLGFKKDKDVLKMLELIVPHVDSLFVTEFQKTTDQSKNFAMSTEEIEGVLHSLPHTFGNMKTISDSAQAVKQAVQEADSNTMIVVTGSLYLIGEVRDFLTVKTQ